MNCEEQEQIFLAYMAAIAHQNDISERLERGEPHTAPDFTRAQLDEMKTACGVLRERLLKHCAQHGC